MGLAQRSAGIAWVIGAALAIVLWVLLPTPTPRARLNVAEVIAVLFFLVLVIRTRLFAAAEPRRENLFPYPLWIVLVAIIAVTFGFYAPTLKLGFISDDYAHIWQARQPLIPVIVGILKHGQGDLHFRPLGVISIFLDHRLWNDWPPPYHFTNLVLHASVVLGVFALTRTLGMSTEGAAGSALIFSILPINAEAVAWIAARFDLLATSLTVWAMAMYAKFRETGHLRFYASALLMFLVAIFSKESAYVLPLFLFCFELIVSKEQRLKAPAGFLLLGIIAFAYRWAALGGIGGYISANGDPSVLQFGWKSLEGILLRGPAEMLLGVNWLQPSGGATVATIIILSAISLALAAGFHSNRRRKQLIWLGLLWLVIAELPAHALLLIGPGLTNSRVLYLGSVGLAVIFGTLVDSIEGARLRLIGTSLVVLVFGILLQHNLRAWQWTSDFSRNSLAELRRLQPSPPANAEFVLSGKPDTIRGVFFFHVGLAEAVKFTYSRPDLRARLENEPNPDQTQAAEVIPIRWNDDRNRPILLNLPYASDVDPENHLEAIILYRQTRIARGKEPSS